MNIKQILNVKEDYEVPKALLETLLDNEKCKNMMENFTSEDSSKDFLRNYFENNQADRKSFMQDFTPDCVSEIVAAIAGKANRITDVCSGTGGLSVKCWNENKGAYFRMEEYSKAALPFSILNMAFRNVTGDIIHMNALTKEVFGVYHLETGEQYSQVSMKIIDEELQADVVVSNPPYSQIWENVKEFADDERFKEFGLPPKSKADFGFVLHAYSKLKAGGIMIAILPHGVLFRGQKEGEIRKKLLESGAIETIIGLPENLFTNTSIPVCLMILRKGRTERNVYFIDASREFRKSKNINVMESEHIDKVLDAYRRRQNIEKCAYLAEFEEIWKNDFNLNIPRFVDTYEPVQLPELDEIVEEIRKIHYDMRFAEKDLLGMMKELIGTTAEADEKLKQAIKEFELYTEERKKEKPYELNPVQLNIGEPAWKYVADIADIERANKGKVYQAGSTLIPLSAVNAKDVPLYLEADSEVDSRYAVITFRIQCIPKYMWNMVCSSFSGFVHRYATGLNIQADALKYLEIPVHRLDEQMRLQNELDRQERIMNTELVLIEKFMALKATMMDLMFAH